MPLLTELRQNVKAAIRDDGQKAKGAWGGRELPSCLRRGGRVFADGVEGV